MNELRLPPTTDSVRLARRFVRERLNDSGCDVDTAVLLASEVVTNAVLHGRSDVRVAVEDLGDTARIEGSDDSARSPRMNRFHVESATGRGLRLVEQLAVRWGVAPAAAGDGDGKVVWFEVGPATEVAWEAFADTSFAEGAAPE
jgi:anti-sigma regulatory factor (Ser/Thr protein kinase)